ncbi:hypothetical protein UC8_29900 [Roseimaritima ulvae]|uniref:Uncharacterized protein n=1 Tax=Roseimaritima ulvae TaxID=980254 RepID=A0A5B9QSV9_9BACT|nr:hypothetical protein UC8_29900 [Roseimaritima ulvae]
MSDPEFVPGKLESTLLVVLPFVATGVASLIAYWLYQLAQ